MTDRQKPYFLRTKIFYFAVGLTLVSAPHLARSYHHLFPLDQSKEIPVSELDPGQNMYVSFFARFGSEGEWTGGTLCA